MCCDDPFVLFRGIKPLEMHNVFGFGFGTTVTALYYR